MSLLKSNELAQLDFIYISDKISSTEVKNSIVNFADENLIKVKLLPDIKLDVLKSIVLRRYEHVSVIDLNHLPLDGVLNQESSRGVFDVVMSSLLVILVGIMCWLYPLVALLIMLRFKGSGSSLNKIGMVKVTECFHLLISSGPCIRNDEADEKWATVDESSRITRVGQIPSEV